MNAIAPPHYYFRRGKGREAEKRETQRGRMARHSTYEPDTWEKYHNAETAQQQASTFDPTAWSSPGRLLNYALTRIERQYTEYRVKRDRVHTDVYESMMDWPWLRVIATVILAYSLFLIIRRGWSYMRQ
jgi:hypothetical protein